MAYRETRANGYEIQNWDSEEKGFPGVFCIKEQDFSISFNGVEVWRVDEIGGFIKNESGYPERLVRVCFHYLAEWLYSRNNPTTEEDFQEILADIQK